MPVVLPVAPARALFRMAALVLAAALLLPGLAPAASAATGAAKMHTAKANAEAPANTVVVTYYEPVTCDNSAAAAAQFTYSDKDDTAVAATAIACVTADPYSARVRLTMPDGTFDADDNGYLTYKASRTAAARVRNTSGVAVQSPQTKRVLTSDTTPPAIVTARAVHHDLLRVAYTEGVRCASEAATGQFKVRIDGETVRATKVECNNPRVGPQVVRVFFPLRTFALGATGDVTYTPGDTVSARIKDDAGNQAAATTMAFDYLRPRLTMSKGKASATEGRSASVGLRLSGVSRLPVKVTYALRPGTAGAGSDFDPTLSPVTIPAGAVSATIRVPIVDDAEQEGPETFAVRLESADTARIGSARRTVVTIRTSDAPRVSVMGADPVVSEGTGRPGNEAVVTVGLSRAAAKTVTVDYRTVAGTAAEGSDYVGSSGTLTFAPGETSTTVRVPIVGDTRDERASERFRVVLSNPQLATLGDRSATVTIRDDDPAPRIAVVDSRVIEGNPGDRPVMVFTVRLSARSGRKVTFTYETAAAASGPRATAGADYRSRSGSAAIAAGKRGTKVRVRVVADTRRERDERFDLRIDGIRNANRGTRADRTGTGTVVDDD